MIELLDSNLFIMLWFFPILGITLMSLVPSSDSHSSRLIGISILFAIGVIILRCAIIIYDSNDSLNFTLQYPLLLTSNSTDLFSLNKKNLLLLLASWFSTFSLMYFYLHFLKLHFKIFSLCIIILLLLSILVITIESFAKSLIFANISLWFLYILLAYCGGSFRGSSIFYTFGFFTTIDLICFISLYLPIKNFYFIVFIPCFARMLILVFTPWIKKFIENSHILITICFTGIISIQGACLYLKSLALYHEDYKYVIYTLATLILINILYVAFFSYAKSQKVLFTVSLFSFHASFFSLGAILPSIELPIFYDPAYFAICSVITTAVLLNSQKSLITQKGSLQFEFLWYLSTYLLLGAPGIGAGIFLPFNILKLTRLLNEYNLVFIFYGLIFFNFFIIFVTFSELIANACIELKGKIILKIDEKNFLFALRTHLLVTIALLLFLAFWSLRVLA
jgi:hypothetical protein